MLLSGENMLIPYGIDIAPRNHRHGDGNSVAILRMMTQHVKKGRPGAPNQRGYCQIKNARSSNRQHGPKNIYICINIYIYICIYICHM